VLAGGRLTRLLLIYWIRPILFVFRRFRVVRIFGNYIPRFDDVQEVLARDDVFRTPFAAKARLLGWTPSFLLAQQDGAEYQAVKRDVYALFRATDAAGGQGDLDHIKHWSYQAARRILIGNATPSASTGGRHEIDAVRDLIGRVPTRIIEKYFGLSTLGSTTPEALRRFEDYLITTSSYMFGDADEPASVSTRLGRHAVYAAEQIRREIGQSIAVAERDIANGKKRDDVLTRMLEDTTAESDLSEPGSTKRRFDHDRITSYLFAMSLGFMPTNLMANGNMLEVLVGRPAALEQARQAARSGDDDRLRRILFEAMRFRPLNPGPWRRANVDFLLGAESKSPKLIRKGSVVWAGTQSAMFDSRRVHAPRKFDADRSPYIYMLYGYGLHQCIGRRIADVQITQTMKALLELDGLQKAGRFKRISMFPLRQTMLYDVPTSARPASAGSA
jgi:cytochrome P450